ncbi:MAG TPA: glycosyltransferase [Bacteroidia bacterium]|jgi:glycosyltransferase involved in cell wall biosynthesis
MLFDHPITTLKRTTRTDYKFSIIIPTWNNIEYLKLCIAGIRKNSTFDHQLIIHVNEGNDGTLEWIKAQNEIDYSYSEQNVGVCYALNSCRKLMSTDYVLYMNDDMYACPGWDMALSEEIEKIGHNSFFISSTSIEPKSQSNCMIEKDYGTDMATFNEQKLLAEFASLPMEDWQGATWPPNIVHKDLWDKVGGYSNEFSPGMYSDPDFSMKLWNAGVRLFKGVSRSRVYHFGSKSVKRITKNPGYHKFISKWGMTSSTLSIYYLKRGEKFSGLLPEAKVPVMVKIKNWWKNLTNR